MRLYHGTHHEDLPMHVGLCLTPDFAAASEYARVHGGEWVHEVSIDLDGLVVEHITVDPRACRDSDFWPGDTARERVALAARGVDLIVYDDICHTQGHATYRIVSEKALAALIYEGGYDPA
jgi:hypothetical protein